MRTLLALLATALAAAALSGCTTSHGTLDPSSEPAPAAFDQPQFDGAADQGAPAGSGTAHGQPQRSDGDVTTGMDPTQVPGFYAKQTVDITNDFGGASLGNVVLSTGLGSIKVQPGTTDGYSIHIELEARALTEQQARDTLARAQVDHTDSLQGDVLHLATAVRETPMASPIPVQVGTGDYLVADITMTVPSGPAYDLTADASSGDVAVSALRGPAFHLAASSGSLALTDVNARNIELDSSSGDIQADTVQADHLQASASSGSITGKDLRLGVAKVDTSSGDVQLQGTVDTLEADASSGSLSLDLHGLHSGAYKLSASSGNVDLKVLLGGGHAYKVDADASSGTVAVDIGDTETNRTREGQAHVVSAGFDAATVQTVVDVETSSGDISVHG